LEFVRVGFRILVLTEFLDLCASDLVVLLENRVSLRVLQETCMRTARAETNVRRKVAFLLLSRCTLLDLRGSCCSFGGFLLVLLALLDALFEFALAVGLLVKPQAKWVVSGTDLTLSPVTSSRWRLAVRPANSSAMITESTVRVAPPS